MRSSVPSQSPIRPLSPVPAHNSPHLEGVQVRADHVIDLPANYGRKEAFRRGSQQRTWVQSKESGVLGKGGNTRVGRGWGCRGGNLRSLGGVWCQGFYDSRLRFLGGGQGSPW